MEKGSKSRSYNSPCSLTLLLLASAVLVNCSSSPKPATIPESAAPASVLPAALPDLPPPPPIRELTPSAPKAVKVLSDGKEGNLQPSLIEASRMAKAKKRDEGEARPVIEITDDNLRDYSSGGQVFVLEAGEPTATDPDATIPSVEGSSEENAPAAEAGRPETLGRSPDGADRELFWRQSVSELRTSLRRAIDDLKRIELESTMLRQQFYSESDPFVRDSEIKPRWDRALDQLSTLRKKAKEDRSALASLLSEAKRSGVAPEWLQEGPGTELTEEENRLINGPGAAGQR